MSKENKREHKFRFIGNGTMDGVGTKEYKCQCGTRKTVWVKKGIRKELLIPVKGKESCHLYINGDCPMTRTQQDTIAKVREIHIIPVGEYRIKHKKDGWTGTIDFDGFEERSTSSHATSGKINVFICQDCHDENGRYHEDPRISSLNELEILDTIQEERKDK